MPCVSLLKRKPGAVTPKNESAGWCQEVPNKALAGVEVVPALVDFQVAVPRLSPAVR